MAMLNCGFLFYRDGPFISIKQTVRPKKYLLILKFFQTCMSFFLLLNTNEDIFKKVGNQTVDDSHWLL